MRANTRLNRLHVFALLKLQQAKPSQLKQCERRQNNLAARLASLRTLVGLDRFRFRTLAERSLLKGKGRKCSFERSRQALVARLEQQLHHVDLATWRSRSGSVGGEVGAA